MYGSVNVQPHSILISTLDRHKLSASRSGRFNSRERYGRTKDEGNATPIKYASPYMARREEEVREDSTYGLLAPTAACVTSLVATDRFGYTAINE
jgi:hypothetical protein